MVQKLASGRTLHKIEHLAVSENCGQTSYSPVEITPGAKIAGSEIGIERHSSFHRLSGRNGYPINSHFAASQ